MPEDVLSIYKHGSLELTDISSATIGGYSTFTRTQVRNDAGSLTFDLAATTPEILHGWMDESATVHLGIGGEFVEMYTIDDYSVRWSALSCQVKCVGPLALGTTTLYTGAFVGVTAAEALEILVPLVPGWVWDASKVTGATYVISNLSYTDTAVGQIVQEICNLAGLTYWLDPSITFNAEAAHVSVDRSYTLGGNARDFDSTYSARNIINRLVVATHAAIYTFDDATSQASYGVRAVKVSAPDIYTQAQAADYASRVFAQQSQPVIEGGLWVEYDPSLRPGLFVEVLGLEDGRTYQALIEQVSWTLGDLFMELRIGHQPTTLAAPVYKAPGVSGQPGGSDGLGGADGASGGGGGLLVGTITAVNEGGTVDVTIDGETQTDIPYLLSYTPAIGDSVAVGEES